MAPEKPKKHVSVEEINNPNFFFGSEAFMLPNGDVYMGEYCAHKTGIVWREGRGIYVTKDEHSYEGTWENDQLLDSADTDIKFASGAEYRGSVRKGKYSGDGTYLLPNKLPVTCHFDENVPVGQVVYTDEYARFWKGMANKDSNDILLLPENQFYVNMDYERGVGLEKTPKPFGKPKHKEIPQKSEESIDWDELKKEVFAKSTKTKNDFAEDYLEGAVQS